MISFDPMFKTMKKKGITGYRLVKMGFSQSTYHNIKRGRGMTLNTLNTLCEMLDCEVSDLIEYVKKQDDSVTEQE
ncbi:MAG: helix-turn-helix domain-containing protein [Hungatella hathewayi]|nr:helix-turn-helix domain-containing protein [Hungatella hathewayi]